MDALIAAQVTELIRKMGQSGDAAGISTLFARLAQIAGYTDSVEGVLGTNADAPATNASIWAMLKTLNTKSVIKSIQSGVTSAGSAGTTVTISNVDPSKCNVTINGTALNGSGYGIDFMLTGITNTTVTFGGVSNGYSGMLSWQVTEYN